MTEADLLKKLINFPSVSPDCDAVTEFVSGYLTNLGFECKIIKSSQCSNLLATIGSGERHIAFLGHLDVVPTGANWQHEPFNAIIKDGKIYGRGAVDMKGAIVCFIAAVHEFINNNTAYKISVMLAGDEEITNNTGTPELLKFMLANNIKPDLVITGEPTNPNKMGEMIKIGRRGSISFDVNITGKQGHVAYPENAVNPSLTAANIIQKLYELKLDEGTTEFIPSNLEVTSVSSSSNSYNVIPNSIDLKINIRYNTSHTYNSLDKLIRDAINNNASNCKINIVTNDSARPFLNNDAQITNLVANALFKINGFYPEASTTGGTSDARFAAEYFKTIEYGLVNKSAHQTDEFTSLEDLKNLKQSYLQILRDFYES